MEPNRDSSAVRFVRKCIGGNPRPYRQKRVIHYRLKNALATLVCLIPLPLPWLFRLFGSDKDRGGGHHYGATYGTILRRFRYRPIKFLEIGIGGYHSGVGGNSLLAWQAFFPFAKIVACDIFPKHELATWNTLIYTVDQSSPTDLACLIQEQGPFDIIVDDGSHVNSHQIFTFETLFGALKERGVYIIEDVQTSFWPFWPKKVGNKMLWDGRHIDDPEFSQTCVGKFLEIAKYLNHAEFISHRGVSEDNVLLAKTIKRISFEHNMIIVEKGPNDIPSNFVKRRLDEKRIG